MTPLQPDTQQFRRKKAQTLFQRLVYSRPIEVENVLYADDRRDPMPMTGQGKAPWRAGAAVKKGPTQKPGGQEAQAELHQEKPSWHRSKSIADKVMSKSKSVHLSTLGKVQGGFGQGRSGEATSDGLIPSFHHPAIGPTSSREAKSRVPGAGAANGLGPGGMGGPPNILEAMELAMASAQSQGHNGHAGKSRFGLGNDAGDQRSVHAPAPSLRGPPVLVDPPSQGSQGGRESCTSRRSGRSALPVGPEHGQGRSRHPSLGPGRGPTNDLTQGHCQDHQGFLSPSSAVRVVRLSEM